MISKILPCDKCRKVDVTGELECTGERLCAKCFAKQVGGNPDKIREALYTMGIRKRHKDTVCCIVIKAPYK